MNLVFKKNYIKIIALTIIFVLLIFLTVAINNIKKELISIKAKLETEKVEISRYYDQLEALVKTVNKYNVPIVSSEEVAKKIILNKLDTYRKKYNASIKQIDKDAHSVFATLEIDLKEQVNEILLINEILNSISPLFTVNKVSITSNHSIIEIIIKQPYVGNGYENFQEPKQNI